MSSLVERIAHAEAEITAREQAAYQEAQRKFQDAEAARLQAQTIATQQEETRKAALIAELSPLLEVVGAREQLEEVRKVWGCGIIDTQPSFIHKNLYLGIRHRYFDLTKEYDNYGEDMSAYHSSSTVWEAEAFLVITVGKDFYGNTNPSIGSFYGYSPADHKYSKVNYGDYAYGPTTADKDRRISYAKPKPFPVDDSDKARKILEDQLFQIIIEEITPLKLAREGREKIIRDPLITQKNKYLDSQELLSPLPWYRRLFS